MAAPVFQRETSSFARVLGFLESTTITWNIVVVGLIIFIPFTTQSISDPYTDEWSLPTAVYAINIALAVIAHSVMLQVVARRG